MNVLELHILQSFGPNVLNRDDAGDPKTTLYGGVRRARISSQSFKYAIRHSEAYRQGVRADLAPRTRQLLSLIRKTTEREHGETTPADHDFQTAVLDALFGADKNGQLKTTMFLTPAEIQTAAEKISAATVAARATPEKDRKTLAATVADTIRPDALHPDVALFGRFHASDADWNVISPTMYAHPVSVHRCDTDLDFFTAFDDVAQAGSHLDHQGFNSPTYYRYAALDLDQLARNLRAEAPADLHASVTGWLHGTILAIPSGKQTAYAAFNPPEFVLATARTGMPISLLGAFEQPVRAEAGGTGLFAPAIAALLGHHDRLGGMYHQTPRAQAILTTRDLPGGHTAVPTLDALTGTLLPALTFTR